VGRRPSRLTTPSPLLTFRRRLGESDALRRYIGALAPPTGRLPRRRGSRYRRCGVGSARGTIGRSRRPAVRSPRPLRPSRQRRAVVQRRPRRVRRFTARPSSDSNGSRTPCDMRRSEDTCNWPAESPTHIRKVSSTSGHDSGFRSTPLCRPKSSSHGSRASQTDHQRWVKKGSAVTATNHDDQLDEIYPTMLNELNCTFWR